MTITREELKEILDNHQVTNNTKTNRNECPMRNKENGNCYPIGGFCSAVNDNICRALKNAYEDGVMDCVCRIMDEKKKRRKKNDIGRTTQNMG